MNRFIYPWRVEVRATRFHPWTIFSLAKTLEQALGYELVASTDRHLTRVRAN